MRPRIPNSIRLAGLTNNAPIGLLDEPKISKEGGINNIAFIPFESQIGTTTIVQRLCGSNPTSPAPSAGVNGYRAVWSIAMSKDGSITYRNLFLWDVCYEIQKAAPQLVESYVQTAQIIVLVLPKSRRDLVQTLIRWYQSKALQTRRVVIIVSQADKIDSAQITPNDIQNLSATCNAPVVETSSSYSMDKLVLALNDSIPQN